VDQAARLRVPPSLPIAPKAMARPAGTGEGEGESTNAPAGRDPGRGTAPPADAAPAAPAPPPPVPVVPAAPAAPAPPEPISAVRVGGQIKEPKILKRVNPEYPEIARQARVRGIVILECTISPQGKVTDVRVLRGIPLLDAAAIDAVRQWEYTPTLINGVPVPVIMTVTVNFSLS
jgi:protein TonB